MLTDFLQRWRVANHLENGRNQNLPEQLFVSPREQARRNEKPRRRAGALSSRDPAPSSVRLAEQAARGLRRLVERSIRGSTKSSLANQPERHRNADQPVILDVPVLVRNGLEFFGKIIASLDGGHTLGQRLGQGRMLPPFLTEPDNHSSPHIDRTRPCSVAERAA
jgi:hypothetical protein